MPAKNVQLTRIQPSSTSVLSAKGSGALHHGADDAAVECVAMARDVHANGEMKIEIIVAPSWLSDFHSLHTDTQTNHKIS